MDDVDPVSNRSQRAISRRRLLQGAAAGAVGARVLGVPSAWLSGLAEAAGPAAFAASATCQRFGVFDVHTFDTLAAVGGQIIPTDKTPGANEACTTSFIELNAAGNPALAGLLTSGVGALDQASTIQFGKNFLSLKFAQQTQVLTQFEAGTAPESVSASAEAADFVATSDTTAPDGLRSIRAALAVPAGPVVKVSAAIVSSSFQQVFFATCRSLTKLAWVINWPESSVRDPATGQPIFSDPQHLISDPDVAGTKTCWEVIRYNVIDYDTEKLLWQWQAGMKVMEFVNGWPVLDTKPLTNSQRLAARDQLYKLSDKGLA